ncbi:hypothetical protein ABTZ93_15015 [Streptomyces sp. NPDC097941]|uniref:hypothetical protein n=1 Tax=Streptomyces sp. NPDC097941 TaxID=3155685 RepID=UPI003319BE30
MTNPFAPPPNGQLSRTPAPVPADRRRWTKESAGGMFAGFAVFWCAQVLLFEPVGHLLPDFEHTATSVAGVLAAAAAYPLAKRWLKRLPPSDHPQR